MHNPLLWAFRHDFRNLAVFVCVNAFAANFLPSSKRLEQWPRLQKAYEFAVDMVSLFSLNWRKRLPSLEAIAADPIDESRNGHANEC